jgi:hypothetical protein
MTYDKQRMRGAPKWIAAYVLVVAAFLAMVARYYHPDYGFTAFLELPANRHESEVPAVRAAPHYDHPASDGYDGQFYAQLAVEPLVRDAAIDHALDNTPYRAHRILFPWIAWALGMGRPAWILQAAALENVLVWLALAWLLSRVIPPTSARAFVLWAGCLLAHGQLMSVRYALPDGLSVLLIAAAILAGERARPLLMSCVIGVAGLARETSVLAASALARFVRRSPRSWLLVGACLVLCVLPLAIWLDYLRSIYRVDALAGTDHITRPLSGFLWKATSIRRSLSASVWTTATRDDVLAFAAFLTQAAWLVAYFLKRRAAPPWALVAASFLILTLVTRQAVWEGTPGAYTRVAMPLTIGVNVLLARDQNAPWWIVGFANLSVVPGVALMFMFRF